MFNDVYNKFIDFKDDYLANLPTNIEKCAIRSAIFSFAASVLVTGEVHTGLVFGALGAVASVIGALTMPIFHTYFKPHGQMNWYQKAGVITTGIGLSHVAIRMLTTSQMSIFGTLIFSIGLNLAINGFHNQYTSTNPYYVVV